MEFEEVYQIADQAIFIKLRRHINDIEKVILQGSWQDQNYGEIAEGASYTSSYLQRDVAPKFWKSLSEALGEKVGKKNFKAALERYAQQGIKSHEYCFYTSDQCFYVERSPVERSCCETILQPGELLRIKAPQKMGKTLLLERLLSYGREHKYHTVKLDLKSADRRILSDYQTFLQWFCADVADGLELDAKIDEYWSSIHGLNRSCTRYFQKYLLSNIENPLILAFDNFERLFTKPAIFGDFCRLLRHWYEMAKQGDRLGKIWQQLRLVVVHSTEVYPSLDTNHSPFNVGRAIDLPEFTPEQVEKIAQHYKLKETQLGKQGLYSLMTLLGGHPYLIEKALVALKNEQASLEEILTLAATEQGIFSDHLRQQLWQLQHNKKLAEAYRQVVIAKQSVSLDAEIEFKLHSLGLVKLQGNDCVPSYDLYRRYFSARLEELPENSLGGDNKVNG